VRDSTLENCSSITLSERAALIASLTGEAGWRRELQEIAEPSRIGDSKWSWE
jgi:hypothetical protein